MADQSFAKKIRSDIQVYVGMALMIGFSVLAVHVSNRNANRAEAKAKEAKEAVAEIDQKLCELAIPSWESRVALIEVVNTPSQLSPAIDPNTPEGRGLQAQIEQGNKQRAERKAHLLELNGPKPCQD